MAATIQFQRHPHHHLLCIPRRKFSRPPLPLCSPLGQRKREHAWDTATYSSSLFAMPTPSHHRPLRGSLSRVRGVERSPAEVKQAKVGPPAAGTRCCQNAPPRALPCTPLQRSAAPPRHSALPPHSKYLLRLCLTFKLDQKALGGPCWFQFQSPHTSRI